MKDWEMKSKEECYNEATLKSLGSNPNGTRMDIIYLAMDIYAKQFTITIENVRCGYCRKPMTKVREGKYQCDNKDCELNNPPQ